MQADEIALGVYVNLVSEFGFDVIQVDCREANAFGGALHGSAREISTQAMEVQIPHQ